MASPDEMAATMIANMPEKTGKSLEQWLAITRKAGLEKHGQIVKLLKSEHGMTHGFANLVAHKTLASDAGSEPGGDDALLDGMFAGPKAALRPLYEAVVKAAGKGTELRVCKTYVALRGAKKQFALVKPATKTRLDIGLNLKGVEPAGRLGPAGSLGAMVTHKVSCTAKSDIDAELKAWLKQAKDAAS